MEYIKINARILGRYPGMVIDESDPHFNTFKTWAHNKDRNGGKVICEMCDAPVAAKEPTQKPTEMGFFELAKQKARELELNRKTEPEGDKKKGKSK